MNFISKLNLCGLLSLSMLIISACNSPKSDQIKSAKKIDSLPIQKENAPVKVHNAEPFFETLDSLTIKIKKFDPSLKEFEVMPSDSIFFEAHDGNKNRVQVSGANNGMSELMWIYNHQSEEHITNSTIKKFCEATQMMCGQTGKNWVLDELNKKATESRPILDTKTINSDKLTFFNDGLTTISLKISIL